MRFKTSRPMLQLALDLLSLEKAVDIACKGLEGGVDILEAGTPLIKSEGMRAVRALKREFPDVPVVADMKTMDTGYLEASMAAEAGADIVTVLAVADDSTIEGALRASREYGIAVEVDLISHPDPIRRAEELRKTSVDILCIHTGIDVQKALGVSVASAYELVSRVKEAFEGTIAVAGGIRKDRVASLLVSGADIIIVGSAITKAADPTQAAREIKEAIERAVKGRE